jgi:hypothetical protein
MPLTTQRLVIERDYLLSLRRRRQITAQEYTDALARLEREQQSLNRRSQRAFEKRERERIAKEREAARLAEIARLEKERKQKESRNLKSRIRRQFSKPVINLAVHFGQDFISDVDLLQFLINQVGNRQIVFVVGGTHYLLNDATKIRLRQLIEDGLVTTEETIESDMRVVQWIHDASLITIQSVEQAAVYNFDDGAFFKYTNNTHFNFSRYGIFNIIDKNNYDDTCLLYAFAMGGMKQEKLDRLKLCVKNRNIPKSDLNKICEIAQICIFLKTEKGNKHPQAFGTQNEEIYNIGLLDKHFFLIEKTEVTRYALENYEAVKDEKDAGSIYKLRDGTFRRDKNRYIDSFDVISILLENKHLLKEISFNNQLIATTQFYDKINTEISSLEFDPKKDTVMIERSKPKEKSEFVNVFFDFETYTKNGVHVPYLCRTDDGVSTGEFVGEDCAFKMLCSLKKPTRLIAHNANYDYRFIINCLSQITELSRGSRLISLKAKFISRFSNIDIEVKDSFHLISMALSKFPDTFKIPNIEKEVMPYELYKEDTVAERWVSIEKALSFVKDSDKEQFLANITRWGLEKDGKYDIIQYSSNYCAIDCEILRIGYNTFREWNLKTVKIDIDEVLTIASLAHQFFVNEGCYDNVFKLGGIPQMFIQGCVVGGRTMCAENKKIKLEEKVNDFDAVSLYPSAMSRMDGFLIGIPKVLEPHQLTYNFLKMIPSGYFVDIIVRTVGIHRKFPLMSAKNDEGVRIFSNDMIGKTLRVDKYTLEDLIKFQKITFDVVRGYYFDNGFNDQIKNTIMFLFNERLRLKKEKNPAEMIYKLIMNSGYGKSIMKPIDNESKFFDNEKEFKVYMNRHYNWITSYVKFGNKYKTNQMKTLDEHFNIAHVGVSILSMSKRIMNEVMCMAEDNGLELYYQDTDSIHIKDCDIAKLSSSFESVYGRQLIGKGLGQFHSDFEMKGCKDVYASRSIFLGKKCYIDELKGTDEKTGELHTDYHIRMKGIPNAVILHTAKKLKYDTPFELYQDLYKGKSIEFDLTNDGTKVNFKMDNDYKVRTLDFFIRKIQFK